jgi:endonuclease/exonuclease/phosphatase family metal-dependent hydrolase
MHYLILILSLILSGCVTDSQGIVNQSNENLKVLTINLCANWNASRKDRVDKLIEFIKAEKIDVILAQEGIRGIGQFNTIKYIAEELGYSYCQSPSFGVPGFIEYTIGVIAASPISESKVVGCQVSGGDPIDKVPFPGSGRGLLVNTGSLWFMVSHLTVPVERSQKEKQVQCLMKSIPAGSVVWGGDFNFTRSDMVYPLIQMQEAVYSGNPQVDMIFYKGIALLNSKIVFEDHYISDHIGVLTEFRK